MLPPARQPQFRIQTLGLTNRAPSVVSPTRVPPGVYRTAPYSCIVVVPGPNLDDRFIVNPGGGSLSMPTIKPDLRFIPLNPPQK